MITDLAPEHRTVDDVRRWTSAALGGGAAPVLAELGTVTGGGVGTRVWRHYARAMALHAAGRTDDCLDEVTAALGPAAALADGGPECLLRVLRVTVSARGGLEGDVVGDLTAAAAALRRTVDLAVRSWAELCSAWAHLALGLHEQVGRHLDAAEPAEPFVPEQPVLVALARALSARLRAADAELAGTPAAALRAEAARHALTAAQAAAALDPPGWARQASTAHVLATWREDPAGAVATAPDLLAAGGLHLARGELTAALVGALVLLGRTTEARAAGEAALAGGTGGAARLDPREDLAVRRALLAAHAAAADPVARDALALVRAQDQELAAGRRRAAEALAVALRSALHEAELAEAHREERRAARRDALTGVGNRRALDEALADAAAGGVALGLLVVDVDDFKALNDTFGHVAGDEVLVAVARLLVAGGRGDDLVCRAGGDEFVVLARGLGHRGALTLADALAADAEALAGATPRLPLRRVRISVGVAATSEGLAVRDLLRVADQRMYDVKRSRRPRTPGARPGT